MYDLPFNEDDYYARFDDRCATVPEAIAEYARNVGDQRPDTEWLCTDYDTWVRNPHYTGKPGPHPEDEQYEDGEDYVQSDPADAGDAKALAFDHDEIPF